VSDEREVTIVLTEQEAAVCCNALEAWADSRMKIARRRDRKERHLTGVSVEAALEDFFALCRSADRKIKAARKRA
jgi:hypothetical protein